MIRPDFQNQPYTAEVLRSTPSGTLQATAAIEQIVDGRWTKQIAGDTNGREITIYHGMLASPFPYHRAVRIVTEANGAEVQIPRTKVSRRKEYFLYDLLIFRRQEHLIVAVPFHGLAVNVFPRIDEVLAGKRMVYEILNITNLVIRLGTSGRITLPTDPARGSQIIVTRCHLAYADQAQRRRDIEQVRLTGTNLGATDIYPQLVGPVLDSSASSLTVTPILLGFALIKDGIKKAGATTDRHGNFKISIGPGLRQATRLFDLLDEIEAMKNVLSVTSNIPIRQSASIEGAE
jgi:hypothetical protein